MTKVREVKKCALCGKAMRTTSDYPHGDTTKTRCADCYSPNDGERHNDGRTLVKDEPLAQWQAFFYPRG